MWNAVRCLSVLAGVAFSIQAGAATEVTGTVTFSRRVLDEETYWSAVIRGEQGRFELSSPFAVGSPEQPLSVLIGGAAVVSGDVIQAVATVTSRNRDTQFFEKVESLKIVERGRGVPPMPTGPFGWACQSVSRTPMNIHASVFQVAQDLYQLRVVAVQGEPSEPIFYPLLRLEDVRSEFDQDRLIYRGESGTTRAELTIREIDGELHLPASLKLVRSQTQPDDPLGAVSETAMVCTPTRNIDP